MANLVVTSDATKIYVDFGALSTTSGISKGTWIKDSVLSIVLSGNSEAVEVHSFGRDSWRVSFEANSIGALVVDSINASAPTSNSDLYDKIKALV